jgi:asparagine synthase (glutamine-hydrolysing)
MCGISGTLNFDRNEPADLSLVRKMTDEVFHRGPDGGGEYVKGPVGLGHRRLSIIDLNTGAQPMCNEDGTVWVTYNGEIYNFAELRADLESRGHQFKSHTDTEVIVHAYEEWGDRSVERFQGMFAFALWDSRNEILLIARDRVGIKPLYYTSTDRALLFASELKSLLVSPDVCRRINPRAVERFLSYSYVPGTETLFADIRKLEPGHLLVVKNGRIQKKQYWDLDFHKSRQWRDFPEAVEELKHLLRKTVKEHLMSDVPVGVLLSGGVDSTAILRFAVEQSSQQVRTFTVAFAGTSVVDERPYARLAAQHFGAEHNEITFTAEDFRDFLPKFVWHMEEPVCEPPAVALYQVAKLARDSSVKVLLSGEGGDEAFGGYETYRNIVLLERLKQVLGPAKSSLHAGFGVLASLGQANAAKYRDLIGQRFPEYYRSRAATTQNVFTRGRDVFYTKEFTSRLDAQPFDDVALRLGGAMNGRSVLDHMLYVDTRTWLPDELLLKADKMTMATSTELRVPLLDARVLEFAASLPSEFKVQNWSTKRVLKEAVRDAVPPEILRRKKAGFPVPYASWLKGELKGFVHEMLLGDNSAVHEYVNKDQVHKLVCDASVGPAASKEVFSLLVLELWHRQFISGSAL